MRPALILFAKAPLQGRVKTRLCPPLTAGQAAQLHRCFVRDTLEMLGAFAGRADVELHTDTPTDAWTAAEVSTALQVPGDLGTRLYHALDTELARGRPRVVVLGSDSPTLPPEHVELLLSSHADVALGPCRDGGYYGISCGKCHPGMFAGVEFSSPRALETTVHAVEACGLSVELGEEWFDVDSPADLDLLRDSPALPRTASLPRHTARFLGCLRIPR